MIKDYDGKKQSPKERAKDMVAMALNGRMVELYEEIRDSQTEPMTDREAKLIEDQLQKILDRCYKIVRRN